MVSPLFGLQARLGNISRTRPSQGGSGNAGSDDEVDLEPDQLGSGRQNNPGRVASEARARRQEGLERLEQGFQENVVPLFMMFAEQLGLDMEGLGSNVGDAGSDDEVDLEPDQLGSGRQNNPGRVASEARERRAEAREQLERTFQEEVAPFFENIFEQLA